MRASVARRIKEKKRNGMTLKSEMWEQEENAEEEREEEEVLNKLVRSL